MDFSELFKSCSPIEVTKLSEVLILLKGILAFSDDDWISSMLSSSHLLRTRNSEKRIIEPNITIVPAKLMTKIGSVVEEDEVVVTNSDSVSFFDPRKLPPLLLSLESIDESSE